MPEASNGRRGDWIDSFQIPCAHLYRLQLEDTWKTKKVNNQSDQIEEQRFLEHSHHYYPTMLLRTRLLLGA